MRIFVLLLLATLPRQEETRSPWDGFKAGSWILTEQKSQGKEALPPSFTQRHSVESVDASGIPVLRTLLKSFRDTDFREESLGAPHQELSSLTRGMKEQSRRRDKISIGERTLDCSVVEYLAAEIPAGHQRTMTIWKADGISLPPRETGFWTGRVALPPDVVQVLSVDQKGEFVETWRLIPVALSAVLTVGEEKLDCSIEDIRYTKETPDQPTLLRGRRRWVCDAVPGRVARREEECRAGTSGGCYTVQVVAFKALR
jgi:hypothetical protein